MERYAAELMNLELDNFKRSVDQYEGMVASLMEARTDEELNRNLRCIVRRMGIEMPWENDFNAFMSDRSRVMRFE